MVSDIEIFDIDLDAALSKQKKTFFDRLQVLTQRIVEAKIDITSNFGSDYFTVKNTYAMFGDIALTYFLQVCQFATDFEKDDCIEHFRKAIKTSKYKTLKKLLEICKFHNINIEFEDEKTPNEASAKDFLEEGVDAECFDEFGFYEKNNQYYTMERAGDKWIAKPFTNFRLKVLFHMNNGIKPRRVIELINNRNKKKIVDIETDKLTGKGDFKKFCEGLGNFRFFGSEAKLDMLKAYLYDKEGECVEINVLGWNDEGSFWSWSNGIYKSNTYKALDNSGFVEDTEKHYYIPSGNKQQPNRTKRFSNEIRFKHYTDSNSSFSEWAPKYCSVFGENGIIIQLFTVACLFSDIVFQAKMFFPILFVYGEGGSGKGSAIKFAQHLFGRPQDPLTLSGKANTDKAKVAITAQFVNSLILLEEYTNNHDTDQMLKNFWDRYGYKRRTLDSGYGTESVPINSGIAVTGNFTPSDDPVLQRIIYLEHNVNTFTQDQKDSFNELQTYSEEGLTNITHELLNYRDIIENRYRETHQSVVKELTRAFASIQVTGRMVENIAVLLSIYRILESLGVKFPYTDKKLTELLIRITTSQNQKRDSGGEVQKFLDVLIHLVSNGIIFENKEYKIDSNSFFFFPSQVHAHYLHQHRVLHGTSGLSKTNLIDKLKIHPCFLKQNTSIRIGDSNTSGIELDYKKMNIDLVGAAKNYQRTLNSNRRMQFNTEISTPNTSEMPFPT